MTRKANDTSGTRIVRRSFLAGAAAGAAAAAIPLRFAHAQGQKLKIGVLLPRTGFQAQLGIDCQRGADVSLGVLKAKGYPDAEYLLADTESKPDVSRTQCEKLINSGAHMITGCFDSGQTGAAAQVCEQKGIPMVVNIAAAPQITESGYKTVFRNFPKGQMIAADFFRNQKELWDATKALPKTAVLLHVNDTFGATQAKANLALAEKTGMPYKIVEAIAYDPQAKDLSVEVGKAKATGGELLMVISRLNDAILITRELVKQRWKPMGIFSTGPGWYEKQYMDAVKHLGDDVISFVPWYDPNKPMSKALKAAFAQQFKDIGLTTNHTHTFEAVLIMLDAFKRAGSTDPAKLIEALRATDIKDNVTVGPGIRFDAQGQNPDTRNSAIQNQKGVNVAVLPATAAEGKIIWPIRDWNARG